MSPHQLTLLQGAMRRSFHDRHDALSKATSAFSISKFLLAKRDGRPLDGFEREMVDEANAHRATGELYCATDVLPYEVLSAGLSRDLNVTTGTAGGNLVQTSKTPALVAFDGSVAAQLGVQIIPGWKDSIGIPKTTTTLPVTWLQFETSAAGEQTPTTGISNTAPKVASVVVDISDKLLRQGANIDAYLTALLQQAAQSALDVAVFAGTGTLGQPLGLLNDTSITSASGTSFNLASAVGVQKTVADNVVSDAPARWAGATDVRQVLQQRVAFASTASPLWADDRMSGRQALASNRIPAGGLLYGDFTEVRAMLWGAGVEIAADPYTQFSTGVTTFRMLLTCDVVVPRPGALVRVVTVT